MGGLPEQKQGVDKTMSLSTRGPDWTLVPKSVTERVLADNAVTARVLAPGSITAEAFSPDLTLPGTHYLSITVPEARVTSLTPQTIHITATFAGEVMAVSPRWSGNPTPDHMGRWHLRAGETDIIRNKVVIPHAYIAVGDDICLTIGASRAYPFNHRGGAVDIAVRVS